MNLIDKINAKQIKPNTPEFRVGDIVRVDLWIKEGKKGINRVFPVNSPLIDKITVVKKGMVRRAKLNFLDEMVKEFKVKERN